jgi:hypothetical protein
MLMCVVVLVPVCGATAALALLAGAEMAGAAVGLDRGAANSAEAAAIGDAAATIRFLRFGEDPTRVHALRPWVISPNVLRATTLEAALWSRRREMIELLDREGTIVGSGTRQELACLAMDLSLPDVVDYLAPDGATCVPGQVMQRVVDRTPVNRSEIEP